ncbi:hypothetical protein RYX36_004092, partial [Vicia faba]
HQTNSQVFHENDDSKEYDSTTLTPKVKRKKLVKKRSATERKSTKFEFTISLGTTSSPPKFKFTKEATGMLHEKQYNKIKRNLFCKPEEYDDHDFYLNNQPRCLNGYNGTKKDNMVTSFGILQPTCLPKQRLNLLKLAHYLLQSLNNVLLNEVLSKATTYWDDQERKGKALVKDIVKLL